MELQYCGEFEAGSSKCKIRNLTVQKYLGFCESHNHSDLNVYQLKKVISIHGFKTTLPNVRKEVLIDAVDSIELMDLTRSTINDDNVSSYAFITSGEAMKDLMCLNWTECSLTSFKTFNSVSYDLIGLQNANDVALKSNTMKKKESKMSRIKDVTEPACSLASGDQCSAKGNTGDHAAAEYLSSSSLLTMEKKPLRLMRSEDIVEPTCSLASDDQCSAKGNIGDSVAAENNSSSSLLQPEAGEGRPRRKRQASGKLERHQKKKEKQQSAK
ncbi:hypothetical protein POM88_004675 [Heracleum sosnowskyi]|uniref:DUF7787 domain-containing protein n=1 Tax=Heracleum sosnowskyi TaxID=360622 RepID=A0AAD8JNE9_9APIA|nr:hypothetical protein POM88_004675 [Heracleum sosnowskyi]